MAAGVASIIFASGNLVLPAHTVYDRQVLVDHVLEYARRGQEVRVRVDYATWIAERPEHPTTCQECSRRVTRAVCRRPGHWGTVYCVTCTLAHPRLTTNLLAQLPPTTILHDVQAHWAYGGEWIPWTRWPQATPAEIIDDIHLQRRFAPVLRWTCNEIRLPPNDSKEAARRTKLSSGHLRRVAQARRSA
jgi:hypothetical protein